MPIFKASRPLPSAHNGVGTRIANKSHNYTFEAGRCAAGAELLWAVGALR
jgi:hypothetical protein